MKYMSQKNYYITSSEGNQSGPYDEDTLFSLIESGLLSKDILIWREGMKQWIPFCDIFDIKQKEMPNTTERKTSSHTSNTEAPYSVPLAYNTATSSTNPSVADYDAMPDLDWEYISQKFWTFKGRINGKTFLKSSLVGIFVQMIGFLMLNLFYSYGSILEIPEAELLRGYWELKLNCFSGPPDFAYQPVFMLCCAIGFLIIGLFMMFPPLIRRMKDINLHPAFVIIQIFIIIIIYTWHFYFLYDEFYNRDHSSAVSVNGAGYIIFSLLVAPVTWGIPVYTLCFIRSKSTQTRFGPYPEPNETPCIPFFSHKPFIFFSIILGIMFCGLLVTFGFNHGTQRELIEAIKKNDAKAVSASIDAGANPNAYHASLYPKYRNIDLKSDVYFYPVVALAEGCSTEVFEALKSGGARPIAGKGADDENYRKVFSQKNNKVKVRNIYKSPERVWQPLRCRW